MNFFPTCLLLALKVAIEPKNLCTVLVSPRIRAHRTFHLLFEHTGKVPNHILTEDVQEWDYGAMKSPLAHRLI